MGDGEDLTLGISWPWLAGLVVALVCAILVIASAAKLGAQEIAKEAMGACFEVLVGGLLVSLAIYRHRERNDERLRARAIHRLVERARVESERAMVFMRAHRSVRSWTEFVNRLIEVRISILVAIAMVESLYPNENTPKNDLEQASAIIKDLQTEYETRHEVVSPLQSKFEAQHQNDSDVAEKARDLPRHWEEILVALRKPAKPQKPSATQRILANEGLSGPLDRVLGFLMGKSWL